MGEIGIAPIGIQRFGKRLRSISESPQVSIVYKTRLCGYGFYRRLMKTGLTAWSVSLAYPGKTG